MGKSLSYKKATTITLKVSGLVDIKEGIINVDGEDKNLLELLKDFDGLEMEFAAKLKSEEELDLPESDDDLEE